MSLIRILFALIMLSSCASAGLWVSEFMASNTSTLSDEDGDNSDWIEIYNDGVAAVNLAGWHLTDDSGALGKWTFPAVTLPAKDFLLVFASGKDRATEGAELHTNFSLKKSGEFLALVQPDGSTVEHQYAPAFPAQETGVSYGISQTGSTGTIIAQGAAGTAGVPSSASDFSANYGGWNSSISGGYNSGTWRAVSSGVGYERTSGFGSWIGPGGDFEAAMYNLNSSVFLRLPFTLADSNAVSALTLRMRWDAGFIAYINGVQVAADRQPASPQWNSNSTSDRSDGENDDWETFSIDLGSITLHTGANLLAIHGLNVRVGSSDMLCLPELDATTAVTISNDAVYFSAPTPGGVNPTGSAAPPPLLSEVTNSVSPLPAGGPGSAPVTVTATVKETGGPVSSVNLFYRIMFGSELVLAMKDNGVAPDATAGDGLYTVNVPTTSLSAGQMLRWRVEAKDGMGNTMLSPAYVDPNDSDRYHGTIAADSSITTSLLPVLHWFPNNASAANTGGGTRSAFFYLGRFYDNIQTDLHGQTTSGFPKKSYDIDFNKGNRFTWKDGEGKVKDINLLTNWADKTKMRNTMAYEVFRDAGAAHHFAFPVRVQQNAAFFSVADMVEDGDDRYLERIGFDGGGALYKMYNQLTSTGSASKKTRKDEDKSDLQTLINSLNEGLSQATRRRYGYDNVDIPETVNYLASLVLAGSADQGHKNYYLYRDTNGTGEWMPLAWDVDLSLGHNWGGLGYFDDDLVTTDNLQFGASNRLKTLIWNSPELNAMFVRRVRSLMDALLQPASTPPAERRMEARIDELAALIDPAGVTSDADLDFAKWGSWSDGGGGSSSPSHMLSPQAQRLKDDYLPGRRAWLYGRTPSSSGLGIPSQQMMDPDVTIEDIEFLPVSGIQGEEYFILKNRQGTAVDVSGWTISGAVTMTLKPGTVIPPGTGVASSEYKGLLHITKNPTAFRARSSGPTGGEYRFIQGGYDGQLSARGEMIVLRDAQGNLIDSKTFPGAPTAAQLALRVSEINYHPLDPTAAETSALPGITASDFEWIELVNIGGTVLDLTNCAFTEGIAYKFASGVSLGAGQRIIVAKNIAAFELRYGTGFNVVGAFTGLLDNSGERLQLIDALGESILDFSWKDSWYPPTDGGGHTLVIRDTGIGFNDFDQPESWGISENPNGLPGAGDSRFYVHFEGWCYETFSSTERADPLVGMLASDPDGDHRNNWEEYCFGTNPRVADRSASALTAVENGGTDYAALEFTRRKDAWDILWSLRSCDDLENWANEASSVDGTPQPAGPGLEKVTLRSNVPMGAGGRRFFRVRAQQP